VTLDSSVWVSLKDDRTDDESIISLNWSTPLCMVSSSADDGPDDGQSNRAVKQDNRLLVTISYC